MENVFHWLNFKARLHVIFFSWTVDLLFMNSSIDSYWLEFISQYIKELLYVITNSKGNQSWKKNKEIYIFTCSWYSSFLCGVKIPYQQFLTFLSFTNIFRSSHSQMFFKIGALKNFRNILNYKGSLTQMFFCEYYEIFKNSFFYRTSLCLLLHYFGSMHFLTVIKQLFRKSYF